MITDIQILLLKKALIILFYTDLWTKCALIMLLGIFIYFFCNNKEPDPDITKNLYRLY